MEYHEAAQIFPMMTPDELKEMADDIKAHGQEEAIVLLDGKILDGRNRWEACKIAGVKPWTIQATASQEKDPVAFVISKNKIRRQLTVSQMAMVGGRAKDVYAKQSEERMLAGKKLNPVANSPQGKTRDTIAKTLHIGGKSVDCASKVLNQGTTELIKAVDENKIAVSAAAKIASEPKKEQNDLLQETIEEHKKPKEKKKEFTPLPRPGGVTFKEQEPHVRSAMKHIELALKDVETSQYKYGIGDKNKTKLLEAVELLVKAIRKE